MKKAFIITAIIMLIAGGAGWYYYDNIIRKNDNDADLEQSVANEVKAAYERLKQKLDDTLE